MLGRRKRGAMPKGEERKVELDQPRRRVLVINRRKPKVGFYKGEDIRSGVIVPLAKEIIGVHDIKITDCMEVETAKNGDENFIFDVSTNNESLDQEIDYIKTLCVDDLIRRVAHLKLNCPSDVSTNTKDFLIEEFQNLFQSKTQISTHENGIHSDCRHKVLEHVDKKQKKREKKAQKLSERNNLIIALYISREFSNSEIATKLHCSYQVVSNAVKSFRASIFNKNLESKVYIERRKFKEQHVNYLSALLESEKTADLTLATKTQLIVQKFPELEGINVETVRAYTRKALKYTRKKITFTVKGSNTDINKKRRLAVVFKLMELREGNYELIFIDECGIGSKPLRTHGWSKSGEPCTRQSFHKLINISCCAAITRRGVVCLEFSDKPFNHVSFSLFLQRLVKTIRQDNTLTNKKVVLFLDNVRFHKNTICLGILKGEGMFAMFNAPYTPQLNIIEYFFSDIKRRLGYSSADTW
jgi:predicted DNA-binding protein YlxM (UPF0122 family)